MPRRSRSSPQTDPGRLFPPRRPWQLRCAAIPRRRQHVPTSHGCVLSGVSRGSPWRGPFLTQEGHSACLPPEDRPVVRSQALHWVSVAKMNCETVRPSLAAAQVRQSRKKVASPAEGDPLKAIFLAKQQKKAEGVPFVVALAISPVVKQLNIHPHKNQLPNISKNSLMIFKLISERYI